MACNIHYVGHSPRVSGKRLRVDLEATTICSGAAPSIVNAREMYRPANADAASLLELAYNGSNATSRHLTLSFSDDMNFNVVRGNGANVVVVEVFAVAAVEQVEASTVQRSTRLQRAAELTSLYVINVSSSHRPHTPSEKPSSDDFPGLTIFESEVELANGTWYRLRLGNFKDLTVAEQALSRLQTRYPSAWIDQISASSAPAFVAALPALSKDGYSVTESPVASIGLDAVDELMTSAKKLLVAGELSQAVQMYTKVLRVTEHDRHAEAQEYLALARERNGQKAHAKAEYQRFLELYPTDPSAARVRQRLAALLATDLRASNTQSALVAIGEERARSTGIWRVQTFFSQYYRQDANQLNDENEVLSHSALYSDINVDARRRGERFDFSSRLSAGYRNEFLEEGQGPGDEIRLSYAYAELADSETGLRGRIGRQSRSTGGVLGRFDGVDLSYQLNERVSISTVAGLPVISVRDSATSDRVFYGASLNYGPIIENLELGAFVIQQEIEGIEDRQAVGVEFRYFGDKRSLWGLIDYDLSFGDLSSAFLQGSWRLAARSTVHATVDRRHSPFLSTGTAMIGQPVESFAELLVLLTEDEIRQLSIDRSPLSTSYSIGISHALSPRFQMNIDGNQTRIEATPASGGVAATSQSTYQYYSVNFTASSLIKEGDVSILGLRMSDSDSTKVISLMFDTRFPFGRAWRVNPRLRVDRREILSDNSEELLYRPGLRIQYRRSQKFRLDFEVGRQFSQRETNTIDLDRKSYFFNVGYQVFF